jgi:Uma2 family endonuclease
LPTKSGFSFRDGPEWKPHRHAPTVLETSNRNSEVNWQLRSWAKKDRTGIAFESGGMFTLPNGAKRAPDAFWILKDRYYALSKEEREERFARIVPDFVIELRSKADNLNARIHRKWSAARLVD